MKRLKMKKKKHKQKSCDISCALQMSLKPFTQQAYFVMFSLLIKLTYLIIFHHILHSGTSVFSKMCFKILYWTKSAKTIYLPISYIQYNTTKNVFTFNDPENFNTINTRINSSSYEKSDEREM